jgi:2TM domain-containing protein
MEDQEAYRRAKRRVLQIKGFYIHATVYVFVNALLIAINLATSRGSIWFFWPLLGWGIGLAAHGLSVFGPGGYLGSDWEERKIKEIIERHRSP